MAGPVLDVFLEGVVEPVGRLEGRGDISFRYLTADPFSQISMSLPVREKPYEDRAARAFFSNLLFENAQRDRIMQQYQLDFGDVVGLLFYLGRDCPGAISCVPKGEGPSKQPGRLGQDYDTLNEESLREIMASLRDHQRVPDGSLDPSPLAGVQGKLAVARLPDGRLALPRPGMSVPTTHILKVPRISQAGLVDQENIAMNLAREIQPHPVAPTEILEEDGLRGLLITRFDRDVDGDLVSRIHQEDFCQALGIGPAMKYERDAVDRNGFSAAAAGRVLAQTTRPGAARQAFLELTLVNLLLGNTDGHAKNHAILFGSQGLTLAPAYDIVPTLADSQVTHELAFRIGNARMTDEITAGDLDTFVTDLGYRRMTEALRGRLRNITENAIGAIDRMSGPARKRIGDVISEQARRIAPALDMDIEVPERDLVVVNRPDEVGDRSDLDP